MKSPLRRQPNQARRFSWFLWTMGFPSLAFGIWGVGQGLAVRNWPRARAVIVRNGLTVRETERPRPNARGNRDEFASIDIQYRYSVNGRSYTGDQVESASLALQNSALSRKIHNDYPVGTETEVAYDPSNPEIAYLRPGPGSVALMAAGIGTGFVIIGIWVRWVSRRMEEDRMRSGTADEGVED